MDPDSSRPSTRSGRPEPVDDGRLRVTVTDRRGRAVRAPGLAAWLRRVAPRSARGTAVTIALISDAQIRALNHQYRKKDRPTDVLSFPEPRTSDLGPRTSDLGPRTSDLGPRTSHLGPRPLGDIAIATGVARRQARAAGHPYTAELKVLALHGLLHLLGYDHHDPADRGRMARLERRLRRTGGLGAGLIERAGARA